MFLIEGMLEEGCVKIGGRSERAGDDGLVRRVVANVSTVDSLKRVWKQRLKNAGSRCS